MQLERRYTLAFQLSFPRILIKLSINNCLSTTRLCGYFVRPSVRPSISWLPRIFLVKQPAHNTTSNLHFLHLIIIPTAQVLSSSSRDQPQLHVRILSSVRSPTHKIAQSRFGWPITSQINHIDLRLIAGTGRLSTIRLLLVFSDAITLASERA